MIIRGDETVCGDETVTGDSGAREANWAYVGIVGNGNLAVRGRGGSSLLNESSLKLEYMEGGGDGLAPPALGNCPWNASTWNI